MMSPNRDDSSRVSLIQNKCLLSRWRLCTILLLIAVLCLLCVWVYSYLARSHTAPQGVTVEGDQPKLKHTATLILLHGLGDTSEGYPREILKSFPQSHIRYVTPTARTMYVSGYSRGMHSWFDIFGLKPESQEDEKGIKSAAQEIESLIDQEVLTGIPRSRIVLGGFSQGGALALYTAFTSLNTSPLAGVLAMSTWLPLLKTFPEVFKGNKATPVFQSHGDADHVIEITFNQKSNKVLQSYNTNVQFKVYKGLTHTVSMQEINDVLEFVFQCLPTIYLRS